MQQRYERESLIASDLDNSARSEPVIAENLNLTLDESSQFSQVLDTQGYAVPFISLLFY